MSTTKKSGGQGMSAAAKNRLPESKFAFPEERKEPLNDASHVRNAIARFDQVEGVSDADRDRAWKRILAAAKKHDVAVSEKDWRELTKGGASRKR
jgi:hypothetical protein